MDLFREIFVKISSHHPGKCAKRIQDEHIKNWKRCIGIHFCEHIVLIMGHWQYHHLSLDIGVRMMNNVVFNFPDKALLPKAFMDSPMSPFTHFCWNNFHDRRRA